MRRIALCTAALALASVLPLAARPGGAPPAASPTRELIWLKVLPGRIQLDHRGDRQRVVVQAAYADGVTVDVTGRARLSLDGDVARLDGRTLVPQRDGEARLRAELGALGASAPVLVRGAGTARPVEFGRDVMPVLMRGGCNSGACHGAARGKDGFRLSLFGYDPAGDHGRITREQLGRRINLALPERSLLLRKAVGTVRHTGGRRFSKDSRHYQLLLRWLQAGAPANPPKAARPVEVELLPRRMVLEAPGGKQQLIVRARYTDGSTRDVTDLAVLMSTNAHSAKVEAARVSASHRGEAFILARFETHTVRAQVIVVPRGAAPTSTEPPPTSYVDRLVGDKLRILRLTPSPVCSDEVFLRRVTLDIVGRLPTLAEQRAFAADTRADRRAKLVDQLLTRKEFVELWVLKWAERLQVRSSNQISTKSMLLYYNWLEQKIAGNVPIDTLVSELLSASGSTFATPATNYFQAERMPAKIAENVAQVFLGMRIQCAQCHNHPFDRWTQDDYYGFAAFFAQIGRKRGQDPREQIVFNSFRGEVQHPVSKRPVPPKFLGGARPDTRGKDRRAVMAAWLTSTDNPWFAQNLANMVWEHFFGVGIVQEPDDIRVSNPPSNPELLTELGRRFASTRYDFKQLVRDICTSRTYQRATRPNPSNEADSRNFARARLRRIRAEVLHDCIGQATETRTKFRGLPLGARAVQIADGNYSTYFLTTFGRPKRETVCSCEVRMEPTLSQALHLLNGDTVQNNIRRGNLIGRRLKAGRTPLQIVDELYRRTLCRPPTARELKALAPTLARKNRLQALEDIFWALLNSREFIFNH